MSADQILRLHQQPSNSQLFVQVALSAFKNTPQLPILPETALQYCGPFVRQKQLHDYHVLMNWHHCRVHPCLPHLLAFPLQLKLMTQKTFPFSVLGLVHVMNRVEQHARIQSDSECQLCCFAKDMQKHAKGWAFDIVCELFQGDQLVWRSLSQYLKVIKRNDSSHAKQKSLSLEGEPVHWPLRSNLGRQYAAVSKDYNPIHLYPWSAKLFGMKTHILHGMYSKARCLSELASQDDEAMQVNVTFKRPLYLPAKVTFNATTRDNTKAFQLSGGHGHLHLSGNYSRLPAKV